MQWPIFSSKQSTAMTVTTLATVERRAVTALPFKTAQKLQTTKMAVRTRRHVVHWRSASRRAATTPTSTVEQSGAATPLVVKTTPEQARHDGIGMNYFYPSSVRERSDTCG